MKKCPKCKAEIQEEARFCLYCMTSFEEKQTIENEEKNNKRWLIIIAAVLVFALMAASIIIFVPKGDAKNDSDNNSNSSFVSSDSDISVNNNDAILSGELGEESTSGKASSPSSSGKTKNSANNENNITNNTSNNNITTSSTSSGNETGSNNSGSSSTTAPTETTAVTYIYRDAKYGDDFSVGASLENAVVITGVKNTSTNGKYIIPETIDGKKVVAIMALAFCDNNISNTVKTVVVPSSVKTIWNNAFANCYNLTDIYFKGNSIYTEVNAFAETSKRNGTLTIHCSANCSDRNYRYYKNSASYYDAKYAEWNG